MPNRKKKPNPDEMSDRDLLRAVFPERVAQRLEEEAGLKSREDTDDERREPPSTN